MRFTSFILVFILISFASQAQVTPKEKSEMGYTLTENDSILNDTNQFARNHHFKRENSTQKHKSNS